MEQQKLCGRDHEVRESPLRQDQFVTSQDLREELQGRDHEIRESTLRKYYLEGSEDLREDFEGNSEKPFWLKPFWLKAIVVVAKARSAD